MHKRYTSKVFCIQEDAPEMPTSVQGVRVVCAAAIPHATQAAVFLRPCVWSLSGENSSLSESHSTDDYDLQSAEHTKRR